VVKVFRAAACPDRIGLCLPAHRRMPRWSGWTQWTHQDMAILRRSMLRGQREASAGALSSNLDRRQMWSRSAEEVIRKVTEADGPAKPLEEISFVARRDLAVEEVVSIVLSNYTGVDVPKRITLTSSPHGKVIRHLTIVHATRVNTKNTSQTVLSFGLCRLSAELGTRKSAF
jgi:hypothetical protein